MTAPQAAPNPIPPDRLFLGVPEVTAMLGLDRDGRTVRKAIEAGEIPATRVGPHWHIPVAWVRKQLEVGTEAATAPEAQQAAVDPDQLADMVAERVVSRLVQALTGTAAEATLRGNAPRRLLMRAVGDGPEAA